MYWRLKLDPPHTYAQEQGTLKSRYAQDFRDSASSFSSTWRCPVTGIVMLSPSFRSRNFGDDFKGLGNWRYTTALISFWRSIAKSVDSLAMFTSQRPAGESKFFSPITVAAGIFVVNANNTYYDNLEWALESNFTISVDEAFCLHYRGLTDELLRKNNWFGVQWDNIYIHVSHQGHVTVCEYADRGNISGTPTVVHEFDIADPGDLLGKNGQFVFLPMPGRGLMMYHLLGGSKQSMVSASTGNFSLKGAHLIPWTARKVGSHYRLFETSTVRIALNPYHANNIGFQNVTFPSSGTYLEETFDPGYKPTLAPDNVSALYLANFGANFATVSIALRKSDDSGAWAAGTDRQGRVKFTLATSDSRYTPFIYGWGVEWLPVTLTRAPGEVIVYDGSIDGQAEPYLRADVLQRLEMTDDSEGNFEGTCRMKIQTKDACIKVERGRGVYQIEYSDDAEEWTVFNGGIIVFDEPEMMYHPDWGFFWQVNAQLHGQEERFEELPSTLGTAFDGATIASCVNLVFTTAGFSTVADANFPAALLNIKVPELPQGSDGYRYHPRAGDKYKKILRTLLFLAKTQNNEYKCKYDWENETWTVVRRPHGEEEDGLNLSWRLTYDATEEDLAAQIGYYTEPLRLEFEPVEATFFQVIGIVQEGENKPKLFESAPITNDTAVTDEEIDGEPNMDYTGRAMGVRFVAPGVGTIEQANLIARKINPRFFHRNILATVMMPPGHFSIDLAPDIKVTLVLPPYSGDEAEREHEMWVKKRTIIVDAEEHGAVAGQANERTILQLDSTWENSFKGE